MSQCDWTIKDDTSWFSSLTDAYKTKMSPGPSEVITRIYSPPMKMCIHLGLKASVNTSFHARGSKFLYSPQKALVTL